MKPTEGTSFFATPEHSSHIDSSFCGIPPVMRSTLLALAALLPAADAHTNGVGYYTFAPSNGQCDHVNLAVFFGTYHQGSSAEGGLSLFAYTSGNTGSASSYTDEAYGRGGSIQDATNLMSIPSGVIGAASGGINTNAGSFPMTSAAHANAFGFNYGNNFWFGGTLLSRSFLPRIASQWRSFMSSGHSDIRCHGPDPSGRPVCLSSMRILRSSFSSRPSSATFSGFCAASPSYRGTKHFVRTTSSEFRQP